MSGFAFDLLRHGDTGQRSYRGQLDDPLTDEGWGQLRAAVAGQRWDRIVSSSLSRCATFAAELADAHGVPLQLDARLAEYHFGHWQGVPIETLAEEQGDALGRFWADPVAYPPPGAESFHAFALRLSQVLDAAQGRADERVLVVTHGGAIRLLRCLVEGRSYGDMAGIDVPHASLHRLPWPPAVRVLPPRPTLARTEAVTPW
ncbi:fructose-2,6-bisphosphatase [Lysobacter daejeonensis GH1-9]|uniref:phosphoglycerate mutase (2,3-diphosphoglycerate-dependent) n=1 Tax=Lysobacter daejeonensis GH1-9 TaxID=1385517 RepID=A0A0A0EX23_9GAMM|nr:histidine phosphatase family protein [Lysobacter daejeonensis]KGM54633.1 fructose-2,6-bisphosphatase [Lysobacter daejeonensis GH1-9]